MPGQTQESRNPVRTGFTGSGALIRLKKKEYKPFDIEILAVKILAMAVQDGQIKTRHMPI